MTKIESLQKEIDELKVLVEFLDKLNKINEQAMKNLQFLSSFSPAQTPNQTREGVAAGDNLQGAA